MKKIAAQPEATPADTAGFERFQTDLARLVAQFEKNFKQYQSGAYDEASVRQEFLNPLFRALGWDIENKQGRIPQHREVEIESRTEIAGRQKRADYLFRTDRQDRFVCEAKKPAETLHAGYAFQAKRYAWNKGLVLAVLSDFEEIKIYLVGSKPRLDDAEIGEWKTWHFLQYAAAAREMWDLLSRDAVAGGSIERLVASLPRKPARKTQAKQQWLFKPDRARAIDADFLDFLDEARRELASDLIRHNDRADLLEGTRLDEAVQRILDRLLFLRICEDRDIDTGRPLANILKVWRDRKETPLWRDVVAHFRALDRRPASHIPYFNGNLFKEHFSETLNVSDDWIAGFLEETSDEESAYLFNVIPVEILGTIYERFLGKTVRPQGRGVVIEEKPEVRKAGGVYYTPRYIVDYIVEQTLGKLLEGQSPQDSLKLRVLDPACGSGSFLIRAYERLCEHWQMALMKNEKFRRKTDCWTDLDTGDVHLTSDLKRRILTANIYGVDLDPGAVEVSQLSLYLKMLEGESRSTLARNRELFGPDAPLLPPLQDNIKCGNSLIASDFSLNPDDLIRVRAFDWPEGFRDIMQNGGFDVVVGNPPYLYSAGQESIEYFQARYQLSQYQTDFYAYFVEKALHLAKKNGRFSFIVSDSWLKAENFSKLRNHLLGDHQLNRLAVFDFTPFDGAAIENSILVVSVGGTPCTVPIDCFSAPDVVAKINEVEPQSAIDAKLINPRFSEQSGKIVEKIERACNPLETFVELNRGIHAYRTDGYGKSKFSSSPQTKQDKETQSYHSKIPLDKTYLPELKGKDVFRFESTPTGNFLSYGPWLAEPRDSKFFFNPKITVRKVLGPKLHGTFIPEPCAIDQSLYIIISPTSDSLKLKFILGILLSSIGAWYLRTKYAIYDTLYPWYTKKQLAAFPIKGESKKLVELVDKMLALVPKLRSAKSDGDRATLQNAVAATDRAIDALVYELYGLTPEEIALVEAPAKGGSA